MIRRLKRHLKRMAKQSPVLRKAPAELVGR
jgi:hypothetical protein